MSPLWNTVTVGDSRVMLLAIDLCIMENVEKSLWTVCVENPILTSGEERDLSKFNANYITIRVSRGAYKVVQKQHFIYIYTSTFHVVCFVFMLFKLQLEHL